MWPDVFRRVFRRQGEGPTLLDVAHAILTGDEADVQRKASAWAAHQRERAEREEERERYADAARELRERVMRNGGSYFPGDD